VIGPSLATGARDVIELM